MSQPIPELYNFLPEKSRLLKENIIAFCNAIAVVAIKTPDQYEGAVATAKELTAFGREAEKQRKAIKEPYNKRVKAVNSFYKEILIPADALKQKITKAIRDYDFAQEQKRKEEQRKLDEQARIEREQKEAEAAARRQEAEAARQQGQETAALELEAAAAEQEIEAAQTIASIAQAAKPQTSGVHTVTTWKCEITDPIAFVQTMIKENKTELLMPNQKAANDFARMTKRGWTFPGGRIISVQTSAVRT